MMRDALLDHTADTESQAFTHPAYEARHRMVRNLIDLNRSPVDFFENIARTKGDLAPIRFFWNRATYLVSHPEFIEHLLIGQHHRLGKDRISRTLSRFLGQGLLTSEGDFWKRQRKLAAPMLQKRYIAHYAETIVAITQAEFADLPGSSRLRWRGGCRVELQRLMMKLTLELVTRTLFGLEVEDAVERVGACMDELLRYVLLENRTYLGRVPQAVPFPYRRRFKAAVKELDAIVYDLIAQRRRQIRNHSQDDDLLTRLLDTQDEAGRGMTDRQIRDEVLTMLLAGHETTALTLTFAWHLLSHHPTIEQNWYREIDRVLGKRPATAKDLKALEWTQAIVQESLRLYPPAWIISREVRESLQVGDIALPVGTQLLLSPWVLHRDPRWFDQPQSFLPQRWMQAGFSKSLPRFAYFPFGGGPRICIGNHFALMEACLVLATMAQHVTVSPRYRRPVAPHPTVTLRPDRPLIAYIRTRTDR